jgi:hypothetical protein
MAPLRATPETSGRSRARAAGRPSGKSKAIGPPSSSRRLYPNCRSSSRLTRTIRSPAPMTRAPVGHESHADANRSSASSGSESSSPMETGHDASIAGNCVSGSFAPNRTWIPFPEGMSVSFFEFRPVLSYPPFVQLVTKCCDPREHRAISSANSRIWCSHGVSEGTIRAFWRRVQIARLSPPDGGRRRGATRGRRPEIGDAYDGLAGDQLASWSRISAT